MDGDKYIRAPCTVYGWAHNYLSTLYMDGDKFIRAPCIWMGTNLFEHSVYGWDKFIRAPCIWMGTKLLEHPVYGWGNIYWSTLYMDGDQFIRSTCI